LHRAIVAVGLLVSDPSSLALWPLQERASLQVTLSALGVEAEALRTQLGRVESLLDEVRLPPHEAWVGRRLSSDSASCRGFLPV
jgi:hypothetical protein